MDRSIRMTPQERRLPTRGCVVPLEKRLFEWAAALMFLALGIEMVLVPKSVSSSAFRYMLEVLYPTTLILLYIGIGATRLTLLVANGRFALTQRLGPPARAACSMLSAVIWLQMDAALFRLHHETGLPPSPGIAIYSVLFLAELYSTYRAASDGRSNYS